MRSTGLAFLGIVLSLPAALLSGTVALAACSGGATAVGGQEAAGDGGGIDGGGDKSATGSGEDPDDPKNQPPHALGTITVGETHAVAADATPIVSASFVPDALKARGCKTAIDSSCDAVLIPKCTETSTATGCEAGKACVFDDDCKPTCQKICSKQCASDEVCVLDDTGNPSCTKETFHAGDLTFTGTKSAITLTPPYAYKNPSKGAPFEERATIGVQAEGAASAGFEAFNEEFTATTFLQTAPAITTIPRAWIYGNDPVPLSWKPGTDSVLVTLSGRGGTVTCRAKDTDGKFDVPRAAFNAAIGDGRDSPLSVSVTRQRRDTKKGYKTKGELSRATVQSEGWLDLVTMSTESASFKGCADVAAMCNATGCVHLKSDRDNCGKCGTKCVGSTPTCSAGTCVSDDDACDHCLGVADTSVCKSRVDACKANTDCGAILDCDATCQTDQCYNACVDAHALGTGLWDQYLTCLKDECGFYCPL